MATPCPSCFADCFNRLWTVSVCRIKTFQFQLREPQGGAWNQSLAEAAYAVHMVSPVRVTPRQAIFEMGL